MSSTFKMLISNWPRTRKFNRLLHLHARKAIAFDFSHCHALITLYVQFLCSDWSKFDRWVHAENLCSVWKLVTYTWSWQSFVSSCDVLNCLFLLGVQIEIQLLSRLFVIHGWFVYCAFCWQMHLLSKSLEIRFRMASFSRAYSLALAWGVRGLKSLKWFWDAWWPSEEASRLASLSIYCLWCVFVFGFLKSSVWFMRLKFIHEQWSK